MNDLVFPDGMYEQLATDLLKSTEETCAVLTVCTGQGASRSRILARRIHHPPENAYVRRSAHTAELSPSYVLEVTNRARQENEGVVFAHSHPFTAVPPQFSPVDDAGEDSLRRFLGQRIPKATHGTLVISAGGCAARELGTKTEWRVMEAGLKLRILSCGSTIKPGAEFDRQIRAFGESGQRSIEQLRVGIVGLGGTGSAVCQQLAHLGVKDFLLIDPDVVESSNLNRLVGFSASSAGQPKVLEAARHLETIAHVRVETVQETALLVSVAKKLLDTDFFFCCTDTHGSRALLSQIAYQYYLPAIDMGVVIAAANRQLSHIAGRVQMLAPGLGCLTCGEILDADAIRWDFMSDAERNRDPYFLGARQPQPAVVTINSVVASLATTMFLSAVTDAPISARYQLYNGKDGTVRAIQARREAACIVCSERGALGRGDSWPLAGRYT